MVPGGNGSCPPVPRLHPAEPQRSLSSIYSIPAPQKSGSFRISAFVLKSGNNFDVRGMIAEASLVLILPNSISV